MADAADTSTLFWQSRPRLPAIRQRNAEHFSNPQTTNRKAEEWELSAGHEGRLSLVKYAQVRDFREAGKQAQRTGDRGEHQQLSYALHSIVFRLMD